MFWNGVLEVVGCLTSKLTSKRFPEMCRRLAVKDCHWVGLPLYFEFVFVCRCVLLVIVFVKVVGVVLLSNCVSAASGWDTNSILRSA